MGHGGGMSTKAKSKAPPGGKMGEQQVAKRRTLLALQFIMDDLMEDTRAFLAQGDVEPHSEAALQYAASVLDRVDCLSRTASQMLGGVVTPGEDALGAKRSGSRIAAKKSHQFLTSNLLWAAVKAHAKAEWDQSNDPSVEWKAKVAARVRPAAGGRAAMRWTTIKEWLPKWGVTEDDIKQYLKSWKPN